MLIWKWKKYRDLSLDELYSIMSLRQEVFVVEQNCPYLDADGQDQHAWHLSGWENDKLVTYLRVLPENTRFKELSFGRVVTSPEVRGLGYGRKLSKTVMDYIKKEFGEVPIRISAQSYLEKFYENFGFKKDSEEYLEDNIPHLEMLRS